MIGTPDHMHTHAALWCMERGKGVYVEKPLTRIASEARLLRAAAQKYKVATQMGNQGYSHEATRVACEIIWSGEIGDVTEVHACMSRPSWPQGMTKTPPPTPVPSTLDWDLWLGTAASRPFTVGDQEYKDFVAARSAARRGGAMPPAGAAAPGAPAGARPGLAQAAGGARAGGGMGGDDFGFYLPFNWRGFYDFGSSLIGDWGVHILGPANWALVLTPGEPGQRRVHQEGPAAADHVPGRLHDQVRVQGAQRACRRSRSTGTSTRAATRTCRRA